MDNSVPQAWYFTQAPLYQVMCLYFSKIYIVLRNQYTVPAAPANMVSNGMGSTWIAISWGSVTDDIESYIVIVTGGGVDNNVTVDSSETAVNVTGLSPNNTYTFRVVSFCGERSLPSDPLIVSTMKTPGKQHVCLIL